MSTLQLEAVVPFATHRCCSSRALCAGRENVTMYWVEELHGKSKKDGEYAGEQLSTEVSEFGVSCTKHFGGKSMPITDRTAGAKEYNCEGRTATIEKL